ncbi:MAG TPA: hypothetical protein VNT99_20310 [Methylomirabilota bacterium]|nr:hypothetical protein [Methylomirabilota bacterium]
MAQRKNQHDAGAAPGRKHATWCSLLTALHELEVIHDRLTSPGSLLRVKSSDLWTLTNAEDLLRKLLTRMPKAKSDER